MKKLQRDRKPTKASLPSTDSLVSFVPQVSPTYAAPFHLAPLIAELERAEREPVRCLVSVPPRHAKTETFLHAIAWWLRRDPSVVCGYASYADRIAWSKSGAAREYARRAGVELDRAQNAKAEWRTTAGGGLLATGAGGPLTGFGVHRLIIDDPHKNRREAESATVRSHIHEWATSTAFTRLEPGGSVFVVHTRWHPDDLIGRLSKNDGVPWKVINLRAINDDGAALWPGRWSVEDLQRRRAEVGEYDWASLFQGEPRPRGGSVFGDAKLYQIDDGDTDSTRLTRGLPYLPKRLKITIGVDFAYTAKTSSDTSVAVAIGRDTDARMPTFYVLEVLRMQAPPEAFAKALGAFSIRHNGAPIHAYIGGTEIGNVRLMKSVGNVTVHTRPAVADKFVRAQPCAATHNAGRMLLPANGGPTIDKFASVLAGFTGLNDSEDDDVDALVAAHDAAMRGSGAQEGRSGSSGDYSVGYSL
jgi:predicted phage terminase large subunit-like protein